MRGLNCPLPILRTQTTLNALQSGDSLKVISTDPGSLKDMDSFCNQTESMPSDLAGLEAGFDPRLDEKPAEREAAKIPSLAIIAAQGALDMA